MSCFPVTQPFEGQRRGLQSSLSDANTVLSSPNHSVVYLSEYEWIIAAEVPSSNVLTGFVLLLAHGIDLHREVGDT